MSVISENFTIKDEFGNVVEKIFFFHGNLTYNNPVKINYYVPEINFSKYTEEEKKHDIFKKEYKTLEDDEDLELFNDIKDYIGCTMTEQKLALEIIGTQKHNDNPSLKSQLLKLVELNINIVVQTLNQIMNIYYDEKPTFQKGTHIFDNKGRLSGLTLKECVDIVAPIYESQDDINSQILENNISLQNVTKIQDAYLKKEAIKNDEIFNTKLKQSKINKKKIKPVKEKKKKEKKKKEKK